MPGGRSATPFTSAGAERKQNRGDDNSFIDLARLLIPAGDDL
jgi:hypothetical protein